VIRSALVFSAALALTIAIAMPAQSQSHGDGAAPMHRAVTFKERWTNMVVRWRHNRPKLKACRTEARKQGLAGDDRWFFLQNCMQKP